MGGASPFQFKIDSGADINVLSEAHWQRLHELQQRGEAFIYDIVIRPDRKVSAFAASTPLVLLHSFNAWIEVNGSIKPSVFAKFFVVKGGRSSLLSKSTAKAMRVLLLGAQVNLVESEENAPRVEPFPAIPDFVLDFNIDESVTPTQNVYFHVPAAYVDRALERLKQMEAQDIIEKVTEATEWCSGMSAVPKGQHDFRLVVNMKGPNRAIRRQFHRFPSMDDIRRKLHGAKFFSKLDISSAFYHIKLGEKSRKMTTFMAADGMYRFKRLVFGVSCAPEIFQQTMERILAGTKGNFAFVDDVLVYAESIEELEERTEAVKARLKKNNLTINAAKCEFNRESLTFLGFKVSANGINIDEAKVEAIRNFREPKSVEELKSFLGLAVFVSTFVPFFADLTKDLWKVTATDAFEWGDEQSTAFKATQDAITKCSLTQGFFSDADKTYLYTDASPYAIGAVLAQCDAKGTYRIISCASKTLTMTEKRYPQAHREALGIVWAVEHFYYFLMGRHFTIRTDAEGIAFIFRRASTSNRRATTRADGWALRIAPYDFDVEYIPGKLNVADTFSRLYTGTDGPYEEKEISGEICLIAEEILQDMVFNEGILTAAEIQQETEKDFQLQEVWSALENNDWTKTEKSYKNVRDQLSTSNGVIVKCGAIVLPTSLRGKALDITHDGHPGMSSMKSILRARVWWPGMKEDIESKVKQCESCLVTSRQDPPVPMRRSALPEEVWQELAIDFNGPHAKQNGAYIFVVVDCYSRFLSLSVVFATDYESVEKVFDKLFNQFGLPQAIKSDNGPPFNGQKYKDYCLQRGIIPRFSTPLHPQQNGMAERYMQVVNKAMCIANNRGTDFVQELAAAVRAHNSAEHRTTGVAPERLMFGRDVRRALPLLPGTQSQVDKEEVRERDEREKMTAKWREDQKRCAKNTKIKVGDKVVVLDSHRAKGASKFGTERHVVIEANNGDFTLVSAEGKITKRNSTHVKRWNCVIEPSEQLAAETAVEDSTRCSSRSRKEPTWLKDYVHVVEKDFQ